jgi:hypothetical protein
VAYEVFCRLCDQFDLTPKGFDHSVTGVISSVMGVSKILGLTREQAAQALNLAVALADNGTLHRFGVRLIGASVEAIKVAEDRLLFRDAMREIGMDVPRSSYVKSLEEANRAVGELGYPTIIRAGGYNGYPKPLILNFKSDTTTDIQLALGQFYQMKVTANAAPVVTLGTPGVALVLPRYREGSDSYFYFVGLGKTGSATGVYVNGVKQFKILAV